MSLRYTLFVVLTLALTAFVGFGTFQTAKLLRAWRPDRNLLLIPAENIVRLGLVAICIGLGLLSGLSAEQLGWRLEPLLPQVGWGVLLGVSLAIFFALSTRWLVARTGRRFYSPAVLEIIIPRNGRELIRVLVAMLSVVALEELLFRSLLLGGLSPLWPTPLLLAATGVAFGLMHSPQGVWGMFGAGLAGVGFGLMFLWTGSLLLPFVAHYVANGVQIALAMRIGPPPGLEAETQTGAGPG